jgi:hypothetical protein
MNKDSRLVFRKQNVGRSGESICVKPEPKALFVQVLADCALGIGVPALDARHVPASMLRGNTIYHGVN